MIPLMLHAHGLDYGLSVVKRGFFFSLVFGFDEEGCA